MCGCVAQQIGTRPVGLTMHSVCSRRKYKRNGMQDQHVSRPGVYEGEAKRERLVHPHMLFLTSFDPQCFFEFRWRSRQLCLWRL